MLQVPLMTEELEQRFGTQIMCSSDILDNETLIVLIHEFGNLRIELESAPTCDVQLENSYLIDFSKELISWIGTEKYSLLDINLFPRPSATASRLKKDDLARDVMTYLWDNYIQLSSAHRVILIGHGPGCVPLTRLLEQRSVGVMRYVKSVIQVVGHSKIPLIPARSEDLRAWYYKHSLVVIPSNHRVLLEETKVTRGHGKILEINEPKPVRLVREALPYIREFVKEELDRSGLKKATQDLDNLNLSQLVTV
jgi:histone deacetylase 6